jgi:hypothetical protein
MVRTLVITARAATLRLIEMASVMALVISPMLWFLNQLERFKKRTLTLFKVCGKMNL